MRRPPRTHTHTGFMRSWRIRGWLIAIINIENFGAIRHLGFELSGFQLLCVLREPIRENSSKIWQSVAEIFRRWNCSRVALSIWRTDLYRIWGIIQPAKILYTRYLFYMYDMLLRLQTMQSASNWLGRKLMSNFALFDFSLKLVMCEGQMSEWIIRARPRT